MCRYELAGLAGIEESRQDIAIIETCRAAL
jgi:hypothetical protein